MKSTQPVAFLLLVLICGVSGVANAQNVVPKPAATPASEASTSFVIENEAGVKTTFDTAKLSKLARVTVKASDHGTETTFEGVSLIEVLTLAGIEFGDTVRGKRLASYILVEAADKYRVVYSLAEIDPGFTNKVVILADKRDGKLLSDKAGTWQIVAPDEKRAGRWVRQVTRIKVIQL